MVAIEMMAGRDEVRWGTISILLLLGGTCFYAAVFWKVAKRVLSTEAQEGLASFAQNKSTWVGIIVLVFVGLMLSPFIEQHRWPFSFPADPQVYNEIETLKRNFSESQNTAQKANNDARMWNSAYNLRHGALLSNGAWATCSFVSVIPQQSRGIGRWMFLQPILDMAHWGQIARNNNTEIQLNYQEGITIRAADNQIAIVCAKALGRTLNDLFGSGVTVLINQSNSILEDCKNECVEMDIRD
jgi:hypothetical protein